MPAYTARAMDRRRKRESKRVNEGRKKIRIYILLCQFLYIALVHFWRFIHSNLSIRWILGLFVSIFSFISVSFVALMPTPIVLFCDSIVFPKYDFIVQEACNIPRCSKLPQSFSRESERCHCIIHIVYVIIKMNYLYFYIEYADVWETKYCSMRITRPTFSLWIDTYMMLALIQFSIVFHCNHQMLQIFAKPTIYVGTNMQLCCSRLKSIRPQISIKLLKGRIKLVSNWFNIKLTGRRLNEKTKHQAFYGQNWKYIYIETYLSIGYNRMVVAPKSV